MKIIVTFLRDEVFAVPGRRSAVCRSAGSGETRTNMTTLVIRTTMEKEWERLGRLRTTKNWVQFPDGEEGNCSPTPQHI